MSDNYDHDPPEDFDYDEYDEPIDSCENCGTNVYEDDVCYLGGLPLCDQCAWHATEGDSSKLDVDGVT